MNAQGLSPRRFLASTVANRLAILALPRRILAGEARLDDAVPLPARLAVGFAIFIAELKRAELPTRAAATAYAFVFALVPFVTTTLAFMTALPALAGERGRVQQMLFQNLLPGAVQSVQTTIQQMSERAAAAGTVSSLVFFVVVLLLFDSVEGTFNRVWKAEHARSWGQRIGLIALFFVVGAVLVTVWVVLAREGSELAHRYMELETSRVGAALHRWFLVSASLLASWALFFVATKAMPNTRVRVGPALLGSVIAGTIWHIVKSAFTWYVTSVASFENMYGALAVIPALFLWIYLTSLLLLVGGTIAFVAQNLSTLVAQRRTETTRGPSIAFYAVSVLAVLAKAFRDEEGALTGSTLAQRLGVAPYVVSEAVHALLQGKVVLAVPVGVDLAYALAVPASKLSLGRVLALATGEDLRVPEGCPERLGARVRAVFDAAHTPDGSALERVTVADLVDDV